MTSQEQGRIYDLAGVLTRTFQRGDWEVFDGALDQLRRALLAPAIVPPHRGDGGGDPYKD